MLILILERALGGLEPVRVFCDRLYCSCKLFLGDKLIMCIIAEVADLR
jgi:hypothetical protein